MVVAGKRPKEDPDWRPMTRCRHVLATVRERLAENVEGGMRRATQP